MTHLHLSFSCGHCCRRSHNWRSSHIISRVERSSQDDYEYAVFTRTDPSAKATEPSDTVETFCETNVALVSWSREIRFCHHHKKHLPTVNTLRHRSSKSIRCTHQLHCKLWSLSLCPPCLSLFALCSLHSRIRKKVR